MLPLDKEIELAKQMNACAMRIQSAVVAFMQSRFGGPPHEVRHKRKGKGTKDRRGRRRSHATVSSSRSRSPISTHVCPFLPYTWHTQHWLFLDFLTPCVSCRLCRAFPHPRLVVAGVPVPQAFRTPIGAATVRMMPVPRPERRRTRVQAGRSAPLRLCWWVQASFFGPLLHFTTQTLPFHAHKKQRRWLQLARGLVIGDCAW